MDEGIAPSTFDISFIVSKEALLLFSSFSKTAG